MNEPNTTLLMSWRNTRDNQLLWQAAIRRGWLVERVRGAQIPLISTERVAIYIESLFAPLLAASLSLELSNVSDAWLPRLPEEFRLREVALTTLGQVSPLQLPLFLKPPNEKSFPAKVYSSVDSLLHDYDPSTPSLSAEPVEWSVEYRCFCLDGSVRTVSPYFRGGELCDSSVLAANAVELDEATTFAERVLRDVRITIPRAIVLDVGLIVDRGWAVVEANAAWGSGIYGCDPESVLDVIEHATKRIHVRSD
jgi:hypothetical protein